MFPGDAYLSGVSFTFRSPSHLFFFFCPTQNCLIVHKMALPGTETIRFRRPTAGPNAVEQKKEEPKKDEFGSLAPVGWKRRHQGLLQDQLKRCARLSLMCTTIYRLIELSFSPYGKRNQQGPFIPSLSLALRLLLLVRTAAAMYSIISDCDEGEFFFFFFLTRAQGVWRAF